MTKLAISGDWHGDLGWAIACLKTAKEADASLLTQLGDTALEWPGAEKTRMADRLNRAAAETGIPIAFIRGNHDNVDALFPLEHEPEGYAKLREWVWYIPDGARFEWDGVTIGGLGGATSIDSEWRLQEEARKRRPRTLFWPDEVVSREAAQRLMAANAPVDLLLTHEMPAGPWLATYDPKTLDPDIEKSAARDREIIAEVRAVTKPRLHAFGHWHIRKSIDTGNSGQLLEGLGMNGDRLGNLIIWDSETNEIHGPEVKWGPKK